MAKQRAKIQFTVELNPFEISVPSQEAGLLLVKKLNIGLRGAVKKALNIPKEAKLTDCFSGSICGKIEGTEGAGFVLVEFGVDDQDTDDNDDSEGEDSESSKEYSPEKSEKAGVSEDDPDEDEDEDEDDEDSVDLDSTEFSESDKAKENAKSWPTGKKTFKPRVKN